MGVGETGVRASVIVLDECWLIDGDDHTNKEEKKDDCCNSR